MKIKHILFNLITTISFIITSCNSEANQIKFEKEVLNQIFKELTDSTIYYISSPPPPPPPQIDIITDKIIDTSNIVRYLKLLAQIDTTKKVIAISDSTKLVEYFKNQIDLYQPYFDTLGYILSVDELKKSKPEKTMVDTVRLLNTGKYKLIRSSNLKKVQIQHPFAEYNFAFYGTITLSRIYFDEPNDKGFLTCEITGRFFHYSFLIFIDNKSSNWSIVKMRRLSIG